MIYLLDSKKSQGINKKITSILKSITQHKYNFDHEQ